MPIKLIPNLRLLHPSLPLARLSPMKPVAVVRGSTRPIPIFSRIFPHRLKYQIGSPNSLPQSGHLCVRRLSTRSIRNRSGSTGEIKAAKSLIDDEAELSDWVSGLRSDSFKSASVYNSDDNDNDSGRGRDGARGGKDRLRSAKRRRDSDSDDGPMPSRQMGRDSYGSLSRNSPPRPGREVSGRNDRFGSRRDSGRDDRFGSMRDSGPRKQVSSGGKEQFGRGDSYGMDGRLQSQRRDNGRNRQTGRDSRGESRTGRNFLGMGDGFVSQSRESDQRRETNVASSEKAPPRGRFSTSIREIRDSEEEEQEKGPTKSHKSFTELISEEDSDDDVVDFDDVDDIDDENDNVKDATSLFASNKGSSSQTRSVGGSESYLSKTRLKFNLCICVGTVGLIVFAKC